MKNIIIIILTLIILIGCSNKEHRPTRAKQKICISFDGSRSVRSWNKILNFSQSITNKDIKFTFFISSVYFITYSNTDLYDSPVKKKSWIGYSRDTNYLKRRVDCVKKAISLNHEIGSHACGHHDGSKWTYDQWKTEFTSFHFILSNISKNNNIEERYDLKIKIKGFRSPLLAKNDNMYRVLKDFGYDYDCSSIGYVTNDVHKKDGIWRFPLLMMKISNKRILTMDYNWYYYHGIKSDNTNKYEDWENQVFLAYSSLFKRSYEGNRYPISIGHHFSVWNGDIYFRALCRFIIMVSEYDDVEFITYSELVKGMKK